ncbi:MAG: hypothetical protein HYZ74_02165 [Elusimicrobia bacterium]|nr:hypothetical protein [Elusimicrobiota bacterium]
MKGYRRVAFIALLVGLGLLHRPRQVPTLYPGIGGDISRYRSSSAKSRSEPPGEPSQSPARPAPPPAQAWRDAPADFPALRVAGGEAPAAGPGRAAVGVRPTHAAGARPPTFAETFADPSIYPDSATRDWRAEPRRAGSRPPAKKAGEGFPVPPRPHRAASRFVAPAPPAAAAPDVPRRDDRDPVDPRRPAALHHASRFPLFWPPRRAAREASQRSPRRRRVRPPRLAQLLGRGARRPPKALPVPDLSFLTRRRPPSLPGGLPAPTRPFGLEQLEDVDPARDAAAACRRRAPHWHSDPFWHDGPARGLTRDGRWLWLWRDQTHRWALREPAEDPFLRHQGLWWSKQRGVWFALHEGELWSWRRFSEWDAEGLIRLSDGVQIVYSSDFTRVAVIVPGDGAVLYDAATGLELGRWQEEELPRRRPRPPGDLRIPRGI